MSALAVRFAEYGRNKRSIRKKRRNVADSIERIYSGIERGVRNLSLVNIEKVAKGLKTSLPELFGRL